MATAVRNSVAMLGVSGGSRAHGVELSGGIPRHWRSYGRIAPGYHADLVALDADLQVVATWINGKQ